MKPIYYSHTELVALLRKRGINPTSQRLEIVRVLFAHGDHVSAEKVYERVNTGGPTPAKISKATVYNTLRLLADNGLIRQVIADPSRVFYDPNTSPHHHIYDVDNHTLIDVDASEFQMQTLPMLPEGTQLEGVDIIVRISRS